jgi:SAM-dependent methyltransferase
MDVDAGYRPAVVARAERLPLAAGSMDAVVATQILGLVEDPARMGREIARVLRPGGRLWLSSPAAWPYDSERTEHRFGAPELPGLIPEMKITELVPQGGMLALPFALLNQGIREVVVAAERRFGGAAWLVRGPAMLGFLLNNIAGRTLETLARRGPLSRFLGYLDRRMPMNFLVVAEKRR